MKHQNYSKIDDRDTGDLDPPYSTTSSLGEVVPSVNDIYSLPQVTVIETTLEIA
jgi:hypothetical protein